MTVTEYAVAYRGGGYAITVYSLTPAARIAEGLAALAVRVGAYRPAERLSLWADRRRHPLLVVPITADQARALAPVLVDVTS